MTKKTSPAYRASKEETIPINKLHPFSNHPFHIRHDLEFSELVDSISESGIITPIIVRPKVGVGYEVISGHRRWEACKELGIESIPARVEYIDDDEATILMVNSNIQREHVLPSEKAFAYKMRMEALKHQGRATLGQVVPKLKYNRSEAVIGEEVGESYKQVQRYIRLTYLIPSILQMVDDGRIAFNPAVEISYMTGEHQTYRVVDAIESPLQAGASALNYHDDFDTDAVQNAGLHIAVAQTVVEGNIMAAAADSAFVIGKQTGNILKDLKDKTINAKDALKAGGQILRLQGGKSVVKIGGATLRSTEQYLSSFQVSADDFTGSVPGKVKEAATNTGNVLKKITKVVLHPLRNLISMGKVILIGAVILLFLIIVSLLGQMSGTTSTSVFGANRIEDVQTLVQKINDYRNAAVTEGIYQAFQNDVDPNGNPYGYDSLTGQRSNNLQHGVTWNYANGIYNDTAEIISLATVYYQQDWPRSELVSAFSDNVPFTKFCRALAAYGLDVTARESAPYSCMSYGGCVNGYRSEGEVVSIKDYRLETHTCSEGDDACGQYDAAAEWHWNEGHAENKSYTVWKEDGTHDVTVFFPVIFPDGATGSELSDLPEEYNAVADGKIKAADCTGNIVLDDSANLYKGELNDWFYSPDELTVTFTVVTGEGEDAVSDDYEVTFSNATAIPWCPGELNDGQYGHYDLDCTIYLTGYDRYTDPETQAPNGADGGTGNLEALAESCDAGTLTRTIIKQDQYGNEYAGNAVSSRYTKTITLPNGASGFQGWYKDGEDTYGNVEWASLLYRMDWEELYGIVDGIKCRATGSGMTEEELRQLFTSLNIDATTARGQVVAFALSCQGKFVYAQPSSLRGGPGNPSVGINLDCSSFVQYCYWAQNLPFSAGSTAAYRNAADLVSISPSEVQPGDLRVVYASGGEQGHVQMALGGGAWIECCYGYGVAVNMSNAWMESRPCYYFRYAGF